MFSLDLQSVRYNGKREDANLSQCLLFFNVGKFVVQIMCPRALIANVHDDNIFGDDPAILLNDRGGIDLVDQRNIHSRANVQTGCNVRHQVRHFLALLRDYHVRKRTVANVMTIRSNKGASVPAITHHCVDGA